MKIKEVEKRTGVTSANIRFYEKENLLIPKRNPDNNYREYSEKDIERINQIKILRMLGISVGDIKDILEEKQVLGNILQQRIEYISEEEKYLAETKKVCEDILARKMSLEMLNENLFINDKKIWELRLEELLYRDIAKEVISRKEMNRTLGGMLTLGCIINALIAFLYGDIFLAIKAKEYVTTNRITFRSGGDVPWQLVMMLITIIICAIVMWFTSNVIVLFIDYLIVAATLTPLALMLYKKIAGFLKWESAINGTYVGAFWLILVGYVLLLWMFAEKRVRIFSKAINILPVMFEYGVVGSVISLFICELGLGMTILIWLAVLYIGFNWLYANMDYEVFNYYFAVVTGIRIMNVIAMIIHMKGRTSPYGFGRWKDHE